MALSEFFALLSSKIRQKSPSMLGKAEEAGHIQSL